MEYQQLDRITHMLQHPERDLGDTTVHIENKWCYNPEENKIESYNIPYNSAVERLFLEILYNAADNVSRSISADVDPGDIKVKVNHDTVSICNGGIPISCENRPGYGGPKPQFIFGELLTSSNYDRSKNRQVGGRFGIGCKATNIFSTYFHIDIGNQDEGVRYRQTWYENMHRHTDPDITTYHGPSYTKVTYTLDFSRFYDEDMEYGFKGERHYRPEIVAAFAKHCIDASLTTGVKVRFNGYTFNTNPDVYVSYYFPDEPSRVRVDTEDSTAIFVDTPDRGTTISFVNDVLNRSGGVHVNDWRKTFFRPILTHLKKTSLKVKERDLYDHISLFLICRLTNPKYRSRTKDRLTSPHPTVDGTRARELLSWKAVEHVESILQARDNAMAKKTDGTKKNTVDVTKLMDASKAGTQKSHHCTLYVTEGDSALNFFLKGMSDGEYMGGMPIKGKFINVSACDSVQYAENEEVITLKRALGLKEDLDYTDDDNFYTLRYGSLIILSDQDPDGMHIRGLLLNFFRVKFPSLLERRFIRIMETPLLRIEFKGGRKSFYYQSEYDEWRRSNPDTKHKIMYYKGLGSSSDGEAIEAFKERMNIIYERDGTTEDLMSMAFDPGMEDSRKDWILTWNQDNSNHPKYSISRFILDRLSGFSYENALRSLPSIVDGLKESQRKIMETVRHLDKRMRVSRLMGKVSSDMHYKHGEESLYRAIVNLGNYCVGTNNVPLIKGIGQYDSRRGKTASKSRYIFAAPSPILKYIFRPEDSIILQMREEIGENGEKETLEPHNLYPIIPIFALNGVTGIGTGYSTDIPAYSPAQIIKYIVHWIMKEKGHKRTLPIIQPWYNGYGGKIYSKEDGWYSRGKFEYIPSTKKMRDIRITEIPVTQTIDGYVERLKSLKERPIFDSQKEKMIKDYKNIPKNREYKDGDETKVEVIPNIEVYKPQCLHLTNGGPKMLGLEERISDTNIVLLDEDKQPVMYGDIYNAIDYFCNYRIDRYEERRYAWIQELDRQIQKLELKMQFINEFLNGDITFSGKSKGKIMDEYGHKYPESFLKMNFLSLTNDSIDRVQREIEKLRGQYRSYEDTSSYDLWLEDLKELYEKIVTGDMPQ